MPLHITDTGLWSAADSRPRDPPSPPITPSAPARTAGRQGACHEKIRPTTGAVPPGSVPLVLVRRRRPAARALPPLGAARPHLPHLAAAAPGPVGGSTRTGRDHPGDPATGALVDPSHGCRRRITGRALVLLRLPLRSHRGPGDQGRLPARHAARGQERAPHRAGPPPSRRRLRPRLVPQATPPVAPAADRPTDGLGPGCAGHVGKCGAQRTPSAVDASARESSAPTRRWIWTRRRPGSTSSPDAACRSLSRRSPGPCMGSHRHPRAAPTGSEPNGGQLIDVWHYYLDDGGEPDALTGPIAAAQLLVPGCGVLGAAVILGETARAHRFRSKDAYARSPRSWATHRAFRSRSCRRRCRSSR